jgi:hypothetical protein
MRRESSIVIRVVRVCRTGSAAIASCRFFHRLEIRRDCA